MLALLSPVSALGFFWSIAVIYLLYTERGELISSSKWIVLATAPAAYIVIPLVSADVDRLTQLAGGVRTLDIHLWYNAGDIREFANALGEAGRQQYAYFQLGLDTLAPPAIAGFVLTVGRSIIEFPQARKGLTVILSVYFFSVLLANALMPVLMLGYPDQDGIFAILHVLLPVLDGAKYATHGLAWLVILFSGLASLSLWIRAKFRVQ